MATSDVTTDAQEPPREKRMTLAGHLLELRRRLMIAALALVVGMVVAYFLTDWVIEWLVYPIREVAEQLGDDFTRLTYSTITGPFDMRIRISFAIGIIISAPVWLWQIWAFIMPGLKKKEIQYTVGFMAAAIPLFFGGCAVAIYLLPRLILVMSEFVPDEQFASQFYDYKAYYDFVFKLITIVGVAFVLPVFLVALNLAGVVSGKSILKGWRFAVIISLVIGMFASSPADVISMVVLGLILFVLYLAAAIVSLLFDRRKRKQNPDLYIEV